MNNVVTVSGEQRRNSAIHLHVSTLPQTSRLPQNIEQSSLCHTAGLCWLCIEHSSAYGVYPKPPDDPPPPGSHSSVPSVCEPVSVL